MEGGEEESGFGRILRKNSKQASSNLSLSSLAS